MSSQVTFESLPIPRKGLATAIGGYRVYSDAANFKAVQARTALEALQASGMPVAYKIVRDSLGDKVLDAKAWAEEKPAAPVEAIPADGAQAPAATADKPTDAPAANPPLSNEDVDKLLKPQ